jgi:hypothetical protein
MARRGKTVTCLNCLRKFWGKPWEEGELCPECRQAARTAFTEAWNKALSEKAAADPGSTFARSYYAKQKKERGNNGEGV